MTQRTCVLDNLELAYDLVAESLREAPQLYDCHLDQALLVLVLAMKRARRSRNLRKPRQPDPWQPHLF